MAINSVKTHSIKIHGTVTIDQMKLVERLSDGSPADKARVYMFMKDVVESAHGSRFRQRPALGHQSGLRARTTSVRIRRAASATSTPRIPSSLSAARCAQAVGNSAKLGDCRCGCWRRHGDGRLLHRYCALVGGGIPARSSVVSLA